MISYDGIKTKKPMKMKKEYERISKKVDVTGIYRLSLFLVSWEWQC